MHIIDTVYMYIRTVDYIHVRPTYSRHQKSETTLQKAKITNLLKEFHFYIWFYAFLLVYKTNENLK